MSEGADPTARLEDAAGGQWLVVTESSTHLFDLDDRTATRAPWMTGSCRSPTCAKTASPSR